MSPSVEKPTAKSEHLKSDVRLQAEIGFVEAELLCATSTISDFCEKLEISAYQVYLLAWAVVLSAFEGEHDVSMWILSSKVVQLKQLNYHLEPSQSISEALNAVSEDKAQSSNDGSEISNSSQDVRPSQSLVSIDAVDFTSKQHTQSHIGLAPAIHAMAMSSTGRIGVTYDKSIVSTKKAHSMMECFNKAISEVILDENRQVTQLDLLSAGDRSTIANWNDKLLFPVYDLVHRTALDHDEYAQAVYAWDGTFTYGVLDDVTSRLAHHLRNFGVRREVIVPLMFNKSAWTVVAILGVLKAGGIVLTLNADTPDERIQYILDKTGSRVMLVAPELVYRVQHLAVTRVVLDRNLMTKIPHHVQIMNQSFSSDAAFVIFTSGSTGQPKGFVLEHGAFCTSAKAIQETLHIDRDTRTFQFASYSFDAALVEILITLMAGGCVCIPSEERRLNDLEGAIAEMNVNWSIMTPTLAASLDKTKIQGLKTLCIAGEAPTEYVVEMWADKVHLLNGYGPAECCPISSVGDLSKYPHRPRNIGRASPNALLWITRPDNYHLLAPVGSIGELMIQGPCLAREYLKDLDRTSSAFVKDVDWLAGPSAERFPRLYRTGDLVRYQSDGSIEYIGRKDTQVKIRSQRIELSEIEYQIAKHSPRGYAATVEVIRPPHGAKRQQMLVAFLWDPRVKAPLDCSPHLLSPTQDLLFEIHLIEESLRTKLPVYMIPTSFLPLSAIPKNPSGKVDRRRLRAIGESLSEQDLESFSLTAGLNERPMSKDERILQQIWADFFKMDINKIKLSSNFFYLGGDSIAAMRLARFARNQGVRLTVADILQHPELQSQTAAAERRSKYNYYSTSNYTPFSFLDSSSVDTILQGVICTRLRVGPDDVEDVYYASDFQVAKLGTSITKNRGGTNYITFDFMPPLPFEQIRSVFEQVLLRYPILRTVFLTYRRQVFQAVLKQPTKVEPIFLQPQKSIEDVTRSVIEEDKRKPVDLAAGIFRILALDNQEGVQRVLLRLNQAQYDGITLIQFVKDFAAAFNKKEVSPISSFPEYLQRTSALVARDSQNYWSNLLSGSSVTKIIRRSRPSHTHVLDGAVKRTIPKFTSPHRDITIATVIKLAWALVLAKVSGDSDVVFGLTTWGRNAPGSEHVMGPCLDTIPMRIQLQSRMSVLDLLKMTQQQSISSMPHEMYGYQHIVEHCTNWPPWERLSSILMYQNLDEDIGMLDLGKGTLDVGEIRSTSDRADLAIYSRPHGNSTWLEINYCEAVIPREFAFSLLECLCSAVQSLGEQPASFPVWPCSTVRIPLVVQTDAISNVASQEEPNVDEAFQEKISHIVEDAWLSCLYGNENTMSRGQVRDKRVPYFEVWGSPLAAYALVEYYRQQGAEMDVEDIIDHPTMALQDTLLRQKLNLSAKA